MGTLQELDRRLYLDINHFAKNTGFAHSFMAPFALYLGVVLLAALGALAYQRARRSLDPAHNVAGVVWAGLGTLLALGLSQPINHLVARPRPYATLKGVEVLVSRAHDFTFPSDHATVAGAMLVGLLLADRPVGIASAAVGLFLAFARVYVGAHYPGDVIAGLIWGALVMLAFRPLATPVINLAISKLFNMPLKFLITTTRKSGDQSFSGIRGSRHSGASR